MYKSCAFASPGHNCSQPLEHRNKKQLTKETNSVSETGLAEVKTNSSYQNSMATANDDIVAAILADMRDSQAPAISPIKSPTKRGSSDSEEDIPASQPPPKHPRTAEGFSSLRNKIAYLETRRAKAKKSLCVLKEHVSKSSCPVGLQYRPRPHLRPDQNFNTDL